MKIMSTQKILTGLTLGKFRKLSLAIVLSGLSVLVLTGFALTKISAAGITTRYVNSADNTCAGHSPCYPSIGRALSVSSNNDIIAVMNSFTEGDLTGTQPLWNITIESLNSASPVTITGGTDFNIINNWTFQYINFTGDVFTQAAPNGITVDHVHANQVVIGSSTGTIGGITTVTNDTITNSNGEIAILGGDGTAITGAITISNNVNVGVVNIFSYVLAGHQSDLAASVTLDHNTLKTGLNMGVNYRGNNTGAGNITGNISITNNTTTAYDSLLGITVDALTAQPKVYQAVYGNITGSVTFANNNTFKLAIITSDAAGGNIDGPLSIHDNVTDRIEVGSNGGNDGPISILNNTVTFNGSSDGTFISVYSFANGSGSIDIENNNKTLSQNATSTGIIVRTFNGDNNSPTTIANNVAFHVIYQVHGTNGAPFTINSNAVSGKNPQSNQTEGYISIVSDVGALQNGTVGYNYSTGQGTYPALQLTAHTNLAGSIAVTGNSFVGPTNILTQTSTVGPGTITLTGNRLSSSLYLTGMNGQVHFNSILGQFTASANPVIHAEDNWWGCNKGYVASGPCQAGTTINGGILEPHLVMTTALTCTATTNAGVAFALQTDNNGGLQMSSIAPAAGIVTSSVGTVGASNVPLRDGAGGTTITLPGGGGSPTATVKIDSQTLTASGNCVANSSRPDTIGIYRSGTFYLRNSNTTGNADYTIPFNFGTQPYPITGDWTGAGVDTIGVVDQSNGLFYLRNSNTTGNPDIQLVLGNPGDQPIAGRWLLSDTHDGVGIFRPSNGLIYFKNALTTGYADGTMVLGIPGDIGQANDWNGDGVDTPGIYRPSSQVFYLSDLTCNCSVYGDHTLGFGIAGDAPFNGDWIGQGHAGIGSFRVSNGLIYLKNQLTTGFADTSLVFGIANDKPVAGHWSPPGPVPPAARNTSPTPNILVTPFSRPSPGASVPGDGTIGD